MVYYAPFARRLCFCHHQSWPLVSLRFNLCPIRAAFLTLPSRRCKPINPDATVKIYDCMCEMADLLGCVD